MVVLGWRQGRGKREATLLFWSDWVIRGLLGLLVRFPGERLDWVLDCVRVLFVEENGHFVK